MVGIIFAFAFITGQRTGLSLVVLDLAPWYI